ncbi:MAG: glycosyltransferase family 2 protein [Bacteroidales bacterium]|nr:glycosyltransferase family 2 protein [Bacteroidales bacterium]
MAKLSVVIITYNEEAHIGRCIESVQGIADEVVVLDSFSTDQTEAISRKMGAIVHKEAFKGYGAQKNMALDLASNDLVLSLDADEALSEELRRSIAGVKENPQYDGYTMNRLNNYCGKWIRHCGWYPDRKIRLTDRRKSRWDDAVIHEKFIVESNRIQHLNGDLLHYSYHSISGHILKMDKFTDYSAKKMFDSGVKAPIWRLLVNPSLMFLKMYFIKSGFLDGFYGFTISVVSAHATFLKYAKLRQLYMNTRSG